ncbi:MAG: hypothetical protein JAY98_03530 [Candidatus Thiodiazotropha lotti]|nr:hypothetical protein [Candidatus Thiodiazotropha lotti]MCW4182245.1 hypothetical protein [Candidatus Thiodiazotropha weberae]
MILPSKHLSPDRALITVASEVLEMVGSRSTVSSIWNDLKDSRKEKVRFDTLSYDWFILSLTLLFIMGIIEEDAGIIKRIKQDVA